MQMCEHDNWVHGIRPLFAGTPLECPYRTTAEWKRLREEVTHGTVSDDDVSANTNT